MDQNEEIAPTNEALVQCEQVIERDDIQTFIQVGTALQHVMDERSYLPEYATFEDYCQQRWNLNPKRAREWMELARLVGERA